MDLRRRWLFVLIIGSGGLLACGSQEGPCSAPGEACGATPCSQSAYCDVDHCVSKKPDGTACTLAKECTGARCDGTQCAGGPLVCTD